MEKIQPTDSELQILKVLWSKGECTVRQINEKLNEQREVGYTTTLKLMQIMHEKGLVERDTSTRTHIYKALATQQKTQQSLMNKIIDQAFSGSPMKLVLQALGNHSASQDELDEIKALIQKIENKE